MDHVFNRLSGCFYVRVNRIFLRRDACDYNGSGIACRFGEQIIYPIFRECLSNANGVVETDGL